MTVLWCAVAGAGLAHEVVTYEQFGAKGDGKTDDLPAIVAAHIAANEKGLPVRAKDGATYYIGGRDLSAVIRTDTDLGEAHFIVDDTAVSNCNAAVYTIPPTGASVAVTGVKALKRGMRKLGVTFPGRMLVKFEDDSRRQYRRTGNVNMTNDGQPQNEFLIVGADGTIDPRTPIVQDMAQVSRARAFPIDMKPLTVRGGRFRTIANREIAPKFHKWNYYHRGFTVNRSNVLFADVRHEIVDQRPDISPYSGFLCIGKAVDVTVSNCVFTAHRMTTHGTYDMTLCEAIGIRFVNCREVTDILDTGNFWAYGSNYCRDLTLDGCEFGRFDAHCGTYNATIRNCRLRQLNAVGWGTFLVENTRVEGGTFCWFRGDYGSNWDGDFVVRNCVWAPKDGKGGAFISVQNDGSHDYGYPCHMGRKIDVDGLTVKVSRPFTWFLFFSDEPAADAPYPYIPPEEISLRNVTIEDGQEPVFSNRPNFFKDKVKVVRE